LAASYAKALFPVVRYISGLAKSYVDSLIKLGIVRDSIPSFSSYIKIENKEWIDNQISFKAANAVHQLDDFHKRKFINEFKDKVGIDLRSIVRAEKLDTELNAAIKRNVNLITNANQEHIERVDSAIQSAIMGGSDTASLYETIKNVGDVFESRAKLIARDQTSKIVSELNHQRQVGVGIPGYYWRTAGDDAVRPSHAENDGNYFAWDNPPAETGNPGDDVQCRCVADPAIDKFLDSIPDEE
jgi:SPP1 gp7 family putative phage head morphogenesis protein